MWLSLVGCFSEQTPLRRFVHHLPPGRHVRCSRALAVALRASFVPAVMPAPLKTSPTPSAHAASAASGVQKLEDDGYFNLRLTRRGLA